MNDFHTTNAFVRIVIGPLGSSKTFGAINEMLRQIHNQTPDRNNVRRSRWCVARNSFPDLKTATIPDFREITDRLPFGHFSMGAVIQWTAKYPRDDGTTVETTVWFRSFDGPEDVKKARGMQLSGVFVDELAEFNKANFDMLIGRVTRYPSKADVPHAKFSVLGTSNACPRDAWLAELALGQTPPAWWIGIQPPAVFKVGGVWVENPKAENFKNLANHYYLNQIGGKKESWIRQNLANEFVYYGDGRPVHPDFSETMHTTKLKATNGIPLHLGMDWGRTPALAVLQKQPNGQWYVLKELCLNNCGSDTLGKQTRAMLNEEFPGFRIAEATGDPSGSPGTQASDESVFDLFRVNSQLDAFPASTNDPSVRYAALDGLLCTLIGGQPALMVDRSCTMLIRGLAGEYCFKRVQVVGDERFKDKPDKGPTSHICEAVHYGLMGAGEGEKLFDNDWDTAYNDVESWAPSPHFFE